MKIWVSGYLDIRVVKEEVAPATPPRKEMIDLDRLMWQVVAAAQRGDTDEARRLRIVYGRRGGDEQKLMEAARSESLHHLFGD